MGLVAIDGAPEWLWPALVAAMIAKEWTVKVTREEVVRLKDLPEPRFFVDAADALMAVADIGHAPAELIKGIRRRSLSF